MSFTSSTFAPVTTTVVAPSSTNAPEVPTAGGTLTVTAGITSTPGDGSSSTDGTAPRATVTVIRTNPMNAGAIAGAAVGGLIVGALFIAALVYIITRRNSKDSRRRLSAYRNQPPPPYHPPSTNRVIRWLAESGYDRFSQDPVIPPRETAQRSDGSSPSVLSSPHSSRETQRFRLEDTSQQPHPTASRHAPNDSV